MRSTVRHELKVPIYLMLHPVSWCPSPRPATKTAAARAVAVAVAVAAAARRGPVAVEGAQPAMQATHQPRCVSCDGCAGDGPTFWRAAGHRFPWQRRSR